jgi:hypothetical protein
LTKRRQDFSPCRFQFGSTTANISAAFFNAMREFPPSQNDDAMNAHDVAAEAGHACAASLFAPAAK